jgi:hypothetical protein
LWHASEARRSRARYFILWQLSSIRESMCTATTLLVYERARKKATRIPTTSHTLALFPCDGAPPFPVVIIVKNSPYGTTKYSSCALRHRKCKFEPYSLRPKIFALVDFCVSRLTIRLVRKNCENIIYFAMTCFIIVYILSIS